jgi:hypothetical protein
MKTECPSSVRVFVWSVDPNMRRGCLGLNWRPPVRILQELNL